MKKGNHDSSAKLRTKLIKSLKMAIKEADILNKILDDQHDMLMKNAYRKAA